MVLAPFFYHAYFPSCRNRPQRNSNLGEFFGVLIFLKSLLCLKEYTYQVWGKLVYPFSSYKRTHTHTHTHTHMPTFSLLHIRRGDRWTSTGNKYVTIWSGFYQYKIVDDRTNINLLADLLFEQFVPDKELFPSDNINVESPESVYIPHCCQVNSFYGISRHHI
jgi:hypothetical protein